MEMIVNVMLLGVLIAHHLIWLIYMLSIPKALHIFQQESNQIKDYCRWIYKNPKQAFGPGAKQFCVCICFFIVMALIDFFMIKNGIDIVIRENIYIIQLFFLYLIFYIAGIKNIIKWKNERKKAKKKFVYTARMKRLIFFTFIALVLVVASFRGELLEEASTELLYFEVYVKRVLTFSFLIFTMPAIVILGAFIASPTEMFINDHYISRARFKILRPKYKNLIRIGITGSYGKTSTKFILKTILSEKYNVLATPESYNTTMGNVKFIREELKPEHEVFISEMGARYKGDIQKICDFVYPQIGLITSIGPQHLETFKTVENVAKTKAELLHAIPAKNETNLNNMYSYGNGTSAKCAIFLPDDGAYCTKLYENETKRNKFSYSTNNKKANVYAKNIKTSSKGCEFIAVTSIGEIKCTSKLLGEYNVQNILGAIAVAIYLGLSKEQIERRSF